MSGMLFLGTGTKVMPYIMTRRGLLPNVTMTKWGGIPRNLSSTTMTTTTTVARRGRPILHQRVVGGRRRLTQQQQSPQSTKRCASRNQHKPNQQQNRSKATLANDMAAKSSAGYMSPGPTPQNAWIQYLEASLRKTRTIPIPRWITPRHYTITISECFGHSSFLLVAISYAVDDFLMLRCIAVAGSTAMLFFTYFHPHGRVLWLPFKWNALFIAINSYRIGRVVWQRYQAQGLSDELVKLRENFLFIMDPVDYFKFIRIGTIKTVRKGDVLVEQGEKNRYVRILLEGELKVLRNGKLNYVLEEANFVSEAGLHAGLLIPGNVESCCTIVAETDARVIVWDRTQLMDLLEYDDSVKRSLQAAISWDVVRKLKFQRSLISRGLIQDPEEWTKRRTEQTQHRYASILKNLLMHPKLLEERKGQLSKYRMIHHIDDEMHAKALEACGWTEEEFESGRKNGPTIDDELAKSEDKYFSHDWKWYLRGLYYQIFGCSWN